MIRLPHKQKAWHSANTTPYALESRALQSFGTDEPVGTQPAPTPLGPRVESPRLHSLRNLHALARCIRDEIGHPFDLDALAGGEVDDLKLQGVQVERGAGAERVEGDLEVAAPARQRAIVRRILPSGRSGVWTRAGRTAGRTA